MNSPNSTLSTGRATKRKKTEAAKSIPGDSGMANHGDNIVYDEGLARLEVGITKLKQILEGEDVQIDSVEFMRLYTICYTMCTQKPPYEYSKELYVKYKETFRTYIKDKVLPALEGHRDEFLLQTLLKRWDNHKIMGRWMARFFNYLDRYYVSRNMQPSLKEQSLICFREEVFQKTKERVRAAILQLIEREREGFSIDRSLLKNVLGIFIEVGVNGDIDYYQEEFEKFLLSETSAHYIKKASIWVQEDSCPEYMSKAEDALKQEEERVNNYLRQESKKGLLKAVEEEILAKYETQVLENENSGCAALLRDNKRDDLARMYRLFSRIPKGLEPVAEAFRKHVEGEGLALIKEVTEAASAKKEAPGKPTREVGVNEQHYISSLIALNETYHNYVVSCFSNSSMFHKALKDAFESFCNKHVANNSSAELMATFCNTLLRKGGGEKMSEDEVDAQLDKVLRLLTYISDKDLFNEFYKKKLGRRLLNDNNTQDDAERSALSKLKQQFGTQFTSKMEGMVNDLRLAKEKHTVFEDWRRSGNRKLPCDLHVNVLTFGFWPTYQAIDVALPAEMADCVNMFKEHYDAATKDRKLTWHHNMGSVAIKSQFKGKVYDLTMTPIQAVVLMLFNDQDELTYADLKEQTNMPDDELMRSLHSLSCARIKVLLKVPASSRISKTDSFKYNTDFSEKARKLKIPLPPQEERKKVVEDVEGERKQVIDAAIVRTMKSRNKLAHQTLILEVVSQLQRMFSPEIRLIKKRIEECIGKEYLKRDPDDPSVYIYLA